MAEHGLNQKRVADDAKVSKAAVSKWMNGSYPGAAELFNLASANGVTVEWFLDASKSDLTKDSLKSNSLDVKSELEKLIARVKRQASKPGAKAELARFLEVDPPRITEWLHDDPESRKEPGGQYTLRLLKWVEQQERKKNADPIR
jgi:predicted transcriptional regulator